jgi:hypothetical protein
MRVQRIAVFLTVFSILCLSRLPAQQSNINLDYNRQKDSQEIRRQSCGHGFSEISGSSCSSLVFFAGNVQ